MNKFYVQWHIVDRCNLRCRHCYQDDYSPADELPISELIRIAFRLLESLKKRRLKLTVALTGGEPLLKQELPELIDFLNSSPGVGDIAIITNGLLIPGWLKELTRKKKFREMKVSLDGASAATNDWIRGQGTYEKILGGIRKMKEIGLPVTIMFTAMKKNQHEVPELIELAKSLQADGLIIERFFPLGQGLRMKEEVLSGEEFLRLWQTLISLFDLQADPEDLVPFRAIKIEFRKKKPLIFGASCVVGKDGMALMPDGTVFPCRRFIQPIGNLREQSLEEILEKNPWLQEIRSKLYLKGRCGVCSHPTCFGCRAMTLALTGDPFEADPHCYYEDFKFTVS